MEKKILAVCVLLLLSVSLLVAGTTGKIAGRVVDAQSNEPLPGANVMIQNTSLGAATDIDGNYFILNVPPGSYIVSATMMGYQRTTKTNVVVYIDQTTTIDFKLKQEVVAGEEVVVVAEKPVIEVDLTASKERITAAEISESWAGNVQEALKPQAGVNINDGIRGGWGLDVAYFVDGLELRESGLNSNIANVNTSAIEMMEVMTGGYNAEYGRANGAIVNIVTKTAKDRIHGSVNFRFRPSGKYHWGRNIYSTENYEWTEMATIEYWTENTGGGDFASKTPEERLAAWKRFISGEMFNAEERTHNYAERNQWETEATLYGPITSKMDFMVSGRFLQGVNAYPSPLKYCPDWNAQAKLNYQLRPNTKLSLVGLYAGHNTTMDNTTVYWSTEDNPVRAGNNIGPYFTGGYDRVKYIWWSGGRNFDPPDYVRLYTGSLKLNHVFNPSTYIDVTLGYQQFDRRSDNEDLIFYDWDINFEWPEQYVAPDNPLFYTRQLGDFWRDGVWTKNTYLKADFVSQFHPNHLLKAGAEFSYQSYKRIWHRGGAPGFLFLNHFPGPETYHPYEGYAYVQDKIELKGMIVNAGLRLDFYNANKKVSDTAWDPWRIGEDTPGNQGLNVYSFDPDGPYAVKTPTQVAISPRIGISHPITENTVLHFMYGHFNMRPGWQKLLNNVTADLRPWPEGTWPDGEEFPLDTPVFYQINQLLAGNPKLEYEKMIQYEVGFDQNIADKLRLDVTMYYKDGKNLTSAGWRRGRSTIYDQGLTTRVHTELKPDYNNPEQRAVGAMGRIRYYSNSAALEVRGIEMALETNFMKHAKFRVLYDLSYASTVRYGHERIYRPKPDGTKAGIDRLWDVSNTDGGTSGNDNQRWNPNNTIKLSALLSSPEKFGPTVGSFYPLGNWYANVFYNYATGPTYTYHGPGDFSTEPNNRRWEGYHRTNLRIAKKISLGGYVDAELSIDVQNLFNNKTLRLMGGNDLENYLENGQLPTISRTGEVNEWEIYNINNMPRQIFFGLRLEY
ncbi:TonB-dependent receptor plug domain-containing protein [candidate division KSB1 bacterium]|nr:TonB-dependent receptor plug domain-containing protein [candidate division KSB1 bacterium]